MSIYLQKSVPIQPRTSPLKFDDLAEKSEKDTVPYLSTKVGRGLDAPLAEEVRSSSRSPLYRAGFTAAVCSMVRKDKETNEK